MKINKHMIMLFTKSRQLSWQKFLLVFFAIHLSGWSIIPVSGQGSQVDYRRVAMGNYKHILCGMDLSPDGSTLAISSAQSFPFLIYDCRSEQVVRKIDAGNWYAGSSVKFSKDGKYVLLNQLHYVDFAMNKDREVAFEIVDVESGKRIRHFNEYHAVAITPDGNQCLTLTADKVAFWDLASGKKVREFGIAQATNGLAISPDGKYVAVSHEASEEDLKNDPRYRHNKKELKKALKYKEQISVYSTSSFEKIYTVNTFYDIIYRIEYSRDGSAIFCLEIPHLKAQNTQAVRQTYLAAIDAGSGEALRKGFTSQAIYEPDFKFSHDGRLLGIVSKGARFLELHVYDVASGQMLRRFEQSYRLFEKSEGEVVAADSRMSFVFLPGDETILMTMGNHLVYWNLNL